MGTVSILLIGTLIGVILLLLAYRLATRSHHE